MRIDGPQALRSYAMLCRDHGVFLPRFNDHELYCRLAEQPEGMVTITFSGKHYPWPSRRLSAGGRATRWPSTWSIVDIEADVPLVPMFLLGTAPASRRSDDLHVVQWGAASMIESRLTIERELGKRAITLPRVLWPIGWRESCGRVALRNRLSTWCRRNRRLWEGPSEIGCSKLSSKSDIAARCDHSILPV